MMSSSESVTEGPQSEEKVVAKGSSKRKRKYSVIRRKLHPESTSMEQPEAESEMENKDLPETETIAPAAATDKKNKEKDNTTTGDEATKETEELEKGELTKDEASSKKKIKLDPKACENCNLCSEHMTLQRLKEGLDESASKKYACQACEDEGVHKVFSSNSKLKAHTKAAHEDTLEMRFECKECPKPTWFATKAKFCYHLGAKHPGIILFVCDICTDSFKLKANYKNHMAAHNIVVRKKFACEVCSGTFVNKAGYEAHKKRFPGPHIQQTCEHCGFSFSKAQHHKNHRCKKLLLEEAAKVRATAEAAKAAPKPKRAEKKFLEVATFDAVVETGTLMESADQATKATSTDDMEILEVKALEEGDSKGKKMVFRRLIPSVKPNRTVYRPIQVQTEEGSEPMIVHEYREIDFEKESVITETDTEQQIIVQDVCGQFIDSNQVLQFDINDMGGDETQQVFQDANRLHLFLWDDDSKRIPVATKKSAGDQPE